MPGLLASLIYAIPAGIRLVELGINRVAPAAVEAVRAFGSTRFQAVTKVQLPLAHIIIIMLGLNQMIMLVLTMVVISGMVSGDDLGLEAVTGLAKSQTGRGFEARLSIVALELILERLTQSWAVRM